MTEIPMLMLKPLLEGYSPNLARNVVTTETEGGMPRQRLGSIGKVHRVSVNYLCTSAQWQYFLAFMRAYEAMPFLANLQLDDVSLKWYECRMIGESLPFTVVGGGVFRVQLDLVARPIKYDVATDMNLTTIYEMTDGQIDRYFKSLEKLANEYLPAALGSL